jgi:hypothetical protein
MWPDDGTVLTVSSRALLAACDRLGIDTEAMLHEVGMARETIDDPDGRLRGRDAAALWAEAYALSGDPVLSLHAAEACPLGAYKVIDYMGSCARTVGEAFRYATRYFPLVNTAVTLRIDESGDPVTFDVAGERGPTGVSRAYAEYCLAVFVVHVRGVTGVPFGVRRVTFVHRAPPDVREHERVFGCAVTFEGEHNRLVLDRAAWEAPTSGAQSGMLGVLIEHADLLLSRLPRGPDLIERTRRAIGQRLRGGDPSLESSAPASTRSPTRSARRRRASTWSSPTWRSPRSGTSSASPTRAASTAPSSAGRASRPPRRAPVPPARGWRVPARSSRLVGAPGAGVDGRRFGARRQDASRPPVASSRRTFRRSRMSMVPGRRVLLVGRRRPARRGPAHDRARAGDGAGLRERGRERGLTALAGERGRRCPVARRGAAGATWACREPHPSGTPRPAGPVPRRALGAAAWGLTPGSEIPRSPPACSGS